MTSPSQLVEESRNGLHILHESHFVAAAVFDRRGRVLGLVVVGLAAVVGTVVFKGTAEVDDENIRIATGLASMLAAALAAAQTFLAYPSLSEKHRSTARQYGAVRRDLERLRSFHLDDSDLEDRLAELHARWNEIDAIAPTLPSRVVRRAPRRIGKARSLMAPFRTGEDPPGP